VKILVAGANGQVGRELTSCGTRRGFEILTRDRAALDITDPRSVEKEINQPGVSLVVNAAGYTAVDQAELEPELAFSVNRDGAAYLAVACAKAGIPLIHISTDYVFDGGKEGPYRETDPVSPLNVYGKSKAAGELAIKNLLREHIIVRTSWIYGVYGHNFVKTMLRLGRENEVLRVVDDQFGCPTSAGDLAETILLIAAKWKDKGEIDWGIYHYCGTGVASWHGFAEEIFSLASRHTTLKVEKIEPISASQYPTHAKRPANSVLDCSLLKKVFEIYPKPWPESLARTIEVMFA
jgi:dTDP-4-dehydrorhamnose reductase